MNTAILVQCLKLQSLADLYRDRALGHLDLSDQAVRHWLCKAQRAEARAEQLRARVTP
jgi:hypothetical protein